MGRKSGRRRHAKSDSMSALPPTSPIARPFPEGMRLSRKEVGVLITGQTLGMAGLVIQDAVFVGVLLAASGAALLYLCWIHEGPRRPRAISAAIIIVAYLLIGISLYWHALGEREQEAFDHISIQMLPPDFTGDPPTILFQIKNNSESKISRYKLNCSFNRTVNVAGGGLITKKGVNYGWNYVSIDVGGDGGTQKCSLAFISSGTPDHPIPTLCTDLTITVKFKLDILGSRPREKRIRFFSRKDLGPIWLQEPVNVSGNFCDGSAKTWQSSPN